MKEQEEKHATLMEKQHQAHQDDLQQWKEKHQHTLDTKQQESRVTLDQLRQTHKEQLDQLESDHQVQLQQIQAQTRTKAMEDARLDIQKKLQEEYEAKLTTVISEHEKAMDALNQQLKIIQADKKVLEESSQAVLEQLEQDHHRRLDEEIKEKTTYLTAEHEGKINDLENQHTMKLDELTTTLTETYQAELDTLSKQHDQQLLTLKQDHEKAIQDIQVTFAATIRHDTETKLRLEFDQKQCQLVAGHQQAMEQLQQHHRQQLDQLQADLDQEKKKHQLAQDSRPPPSPSLSEDEIKIQVESALQKVHAAELARLETEHELKEKEWLVTYEQQRTEAIMALERTHREQLEQVVADHQLALTQLHESHQQQRLECEKYQEEKAQSALEKALAELKQDHDHEISTIEASHAEELERLQQLQQDHLDEIQQLQQATEKTHRLELETLKKEHALALAALEQEVTPSSSLDHHDTRQVELDTLQSQHADELAKLQVEHTSAIQQARELARCELETSLAEDYERQMNELTRTHHDTLSRLEKQIIEQKQEAARLQEEHQTTLLALEADYRNKVQAAEARRDKEYHLLKEEIEANVQQQVDEAWNELNQEHACRTKELNEQHAQAMGDLESRYNELKAQSETRLGQVVVDIDRLKQHAQALEQEQQLHLNKVAESHAHIWLSLQQQGGRGDQLEELQLLLTDEKHQFASKTDQLAKLVDSLAELESRLNNICKSDDNDQAQKEDWVKMNQTIETKEKSLKDTRQQLQDLSSASSPQQQPTIDILQTHHEKETELLRSQFQQLVQLKDLELQEFSRRLNQMTSDQKLALASQQKEHVDQVQALQQEIQQWQEKLKSKDMEMGWLETDVEGYETKIKEQHDNIVIMEQENQKLHHQVDQYKDENEQMLRLIHQLQGEMHSLHQHH
ncbi:hypothetical protein BC941DRAFT_441717 [Chlamydoabsidia padenii]|nr:hypothetical protein BC941DRAFT_441717 [Chlamydoabsidia padenii]